MIYNSLILFKPDAFKRHLVGKLFDRFDKFVDELKFVAGDTDILRCQLFMPCLATSKRLEQHYAEHKDKSFYHDLLSFMTSGNIMALRIDSYVPTLVADLRNFVGSTDPKKAQFGTIRGDLCDKNPKVPINRNLVHASDSDVSAAREIVIWGLNV